MYGIDLGTTNSLLCYYDKATDTSVDLSGLIPSFVNMVTNEAGKDIKDKYYAGDVEDVLSSYKIDMSMSSSGEYARFASSLVLQKIGTITKDPVVITVPAYFTDTQRKATLKSAQDAGLIVNTIINEPTAAALYYTRNTKEKIIVYDLGGGTFDVSVIDTTEGIYDVVMTDGLDIGGDNLDSAIQSDLYGTCGLRRHRLPKDADKVIKSACETLKLAVQKNGNGSLNFPEYADAFKSTVYFLNAEKYTEIVKKTFYVTIMKLMNLIRESGYNKSDLKLILVGGSTHDPYLVKLISDIMIPEPVTYDPDKIVAMGASYYNYLFSIGEVSTVSDVAKAISVALSDGTADILIPANSKIPISRTKMYNNTIKCDKLLLNVLQGNSNRAVLNDLIGELSYAYNCIKEPHEGNVKVNLSVGLGGIINLSVKEPGKAEVKTSLIYK